MARRNGYPIIGGPLHGCLAKEADFLPERRALRSYGRYREGDIVREGGKFASFCQVYVPFNRANRTDPVASRIWFHISIIDSWGKTP